MLKVQSQRADKRSCDSYWRVTECASVDTEVGTGDNELLIFIFLKRFSGYLGLWKVWLPPLTEYTP